MCRGPTLQCRGVKHLPGGSADRTAQPLHDEPCNQEEKNTCSSVRFSRWRLGRGVHDGVALAQENATLLMRSGETVSRLSSSTWAVWLHDARQRPGTADSDRRRGRHRLHRQPETDTDWSQGGGGQQIVICGTARPSTARSTTSAARRRCKITVRTSSGEREFSSGEIGRIVLSKPTNAVATSGTTTSTVPPARDRGRGQPGVDRDGPDRAQGRDPDVQHHRPGAAEHRHSDIATPPARSLAGTPTAPRSRRARGRADRPHRTTASRSRSATRRLGAPRRPAGQLFLGINDDNLGDNQGGFRVDITLLDASITGAGLARARQRGPASFGAPRPVALSAAGQPIGSCGNACGAWFCLALDGTLAHAARQAALRASAHSRDPAILTLATAAVAGS